MYAALWRISYKPTNGGSRFWKSRSIADVGPTAGDREDGAFLAQQVECPDGCIPADVVLLLKLADRWQRAMPPLPCADPLPQDVRKLAVGGLRRAVVNRHRPTVGQDIPALIRAYICTVLCCASLI